jgi:hypothetical protein
MNFTTTINMVTTASLFAFSESWTRKSKITDHRSPRASETGWSPCFSFGLFLRWCRIGQPNRYSQGRHDIRIWQMLKKTVLRTSILLLVTSLALVSGCTNASSSSNPPTTTAPVGGSNAPQTAEKKESGGT